MVPNSLFFKISAPVMNNPPSGNTFVKPLFYYLQNMYNTINYLQNMYNAINYFVYNILFEINF